MLYRRHLTAALVLLAAACTDSPTGPVIEDTVLTTDLADIAADGVAEDIGIMATLDGVVPSFGASLLAAPSGPRLNSCTFADGSYACPKVRDNGLEVERTVTLFDAEGVKQNGYSNLTTASVRLEVSVTGSITRGLWTATIDRQRDFTISGLAGSETTRTVNGTGEEDVSRSGHGRNGNSRGYSLHGTTTATDVVFPVRQSNSEPWPRSGTITRVFTVTPLNGEPMTRTVVINFDGTSAPTGTVNGEVFTFDLTHRRAARP